MKKPLAYTLFVALAFAAASQTTEYVDDEECGCELFFVDGIQTTRDGDLHGFKLADGTVIVENKYKYVDQFHGDYCKVYLDVGFAGMIDRTGREVVPCRYDDVNYPASGRILVVKDFKAGYYDLNGNEVIAPRYWQASDFSGGIATVASNDGTSAYCYFIDTLGNQLFDTIFENARPFNQGYAPVRRNGLWGILDSTGHLALPCRYEAITDNVNGHFFAGTMQGLAMFDYTMQPLTPFIYYFSSAESDNHFSVIRDGRYGILDGSGREVVPCQYDELGALLQGRVMVRLGNRYGIVDSLGNTILPVEYEGKTLSGTKYTYYDNRALVEKDGKVGFVDLDGNLVIPLLFQQAYQFSQGLAAVRHNGLWGYIDTAGDLYMPCVFTLASPFRWGRAEVLYNGTVSKVDLRGRCVKNCNGVIAWRKLDE